MAEAIDRTGDTFVNKEGCVGRIVKYKNAREVYVLFENCIEPIKCNYSNIRKGSVKNPYNPIVCGVGYKGQGEYSSHVNGVANKCYETWRGMLTRAYSIDYQKKHSTYMYCTVCEEWHNYQNFAKWYDENYYEVNGEQMCLDKDILVKGNKVYSPETCVFVPQRINKLSLKHDSKRGSAPLGCYYREDCNKYEVYCQTGTKKRNNLGMYDSDKEAFQVYKTFKEQYIKQVAEEYKNKIPQELYEAMYSYKVEITD